MQDFSGLSDLIQADEGIDFILEFFGEFGGKSLREAAAHDEFLSGPFAQSALLVGFQDGFDGFFLGRIDEAAGIDNEDIGFLWVGCDFEALASGISQHDLGIDQIFGAAQADHAHFGRAGKTSVFHGWLGDREGSGVDESGVGLEVTSAGKAGKTGRAGRAGSTVRFAGGASVAASVAGFVGEVSSFAVSTKLVL